MPRPKWSPDTATDEQMQLVETAVRAFQQARQWERVGYADIRAAQAAGVPIEYLAARIKAATDAKISPATIYRHIDEAETDVEAEPGIVAELPPQMRRVVDRELDKAGWSARDFLLASLAMLVKNPGPYLARLGEVYERRRDRRRRGER